MPEVKCPKCGSENVAPGKLEVNKGCNILIAYCTSCISAWTEWQRQIIDSQREQISSLQKQLEEKDKLIEWHKSIKAQDADTHIAIETTLRAQNEILNERVRNYDDLRQAMVDTANENEKLREGLRKLEWAGKGQFSGLPCCPICRVNKDSGKPHFDCWLKALIGDRE